LNRDEKAAVVEEISTQISDAEAIFAVDYRGISVPQAAELRSKLREADASFRVVKNRLTKLAADKAGREELKELLEGPTALTFVRGDTASAAKTISTFNREHEILSFKGGYMDGATLDETTFTSIARLPSRDVLNGQFAGVVASPITGLVRGLNSMISGIAVQLQQMADQGLVSGEAPAEEAPAEEAPAEEAEAPAEEEESSAEEDAPAEEAPAEAPSEPAPEEEQPEADGGNSSEDSSNEEE
jgi:large subunit ribosomal protein L10